jgi:hypothetical protein
MPRAIFRDVGGRSFVAELPATARMNEACHFIASSLSLRDDQIRILNDSRIAKTHFYRSDDPLFPFYVIPPLHYYFQVIIRDPQPVAMPPPRGLAAVCAKSAQEQLEHRGYARMIRRLPADLDARLEPLLAMGYDREKCEEAYRNAGGDIERAAERLAEGRPLAPLMFGDSTDFIAFIVRRRAELERAAEAERLQREAERSQEGVFRRLKRTFEVNDEFLEEQLRAVGNDVARLEAIFHQTDELLKN